MNKNDVKKGDSIVKILIGGGETACLVKVEKVSKDTIYIDGCNGDYNRDSVYAYDLDTGRLCSNYIPGFTSRLIVFEKD